MHTRRLMLLRYSFCFVLLFFPHTLFKSTNLLSIHHDLDPVFIESGKNVYSYPDS